MQWKFMLMNYVCGILGTFLAEEEYTPQCYSCVSEEWNISQDCEDPLTPFGDNPDILKAEKCSHCYIIYGKGDDFLVRTCMSEIEFSKSKYKDDTKYKVVKTCNDEDLCNRTPIVWDELDTFQGTEHTLNEDEVKTCYRCLSVTSKYCDTVQNGTKVSRKGKCQNRICVTIHSEKMKAIKRDCYSWRKVKKFIHEGQSDWTVDWCRNQNCNIKAMSDFPGCKAGASKHLVRAGGCVVVKDWKQDTAGRVTIANLILMLAAVLVSCR